MDKFLKFISRRRFFWPLLVLPGIWRLAVPALTDSLGFNPLFELLHRAGQIAVLMLIAVLAFTPLKTLFPNSTLAAALNRHRRAAGVAAFAYASLHVAANFLYEGEFKGYLLNFWKWFFLTGTFGISVLALLAFTSNDFSVRRLGYPFWKWLHRLVHFATLALAWHIATAGKGNWPFARKVFIPLLILQTLRLGKMMLLYLGQIVSRWRRPNEWKGWREFQIVRRETESDNIMSLYLAPTDARPLPGFKPGQFLTIEVSIPNQHAPEIRTYTISDAPNPKTYRLTIKRARASSTSPDVPQGLVSNFFHDHMRVGSVLRAKSPAGEFCLQQESRRPVVLLSAGVGITPMIAMLNSLCANRGSRPIWFLHGARNRSEHAFGPHVRDIASNHPNVHVHICYSQPTPQDIDEGLCDNGGRLDINLLKWLLPERLADFYLCGPGPFMKSLHHGLREWGVPSERIHYEFFGPSTVNLNKPGSRVEVTTSFRHVEFRPAGISCRWDGSHSSLLDLALAAGLKPAYGCKSGICGSCESRVLQGKVRYSQTPAAATETGFALLCCSMPDSDVVIECE